MKYLALSILALVITGCSGCKTTTTMPLQPGEQIWFESKERADIFRGLSHQNRGHTSRVVVVEEPIRIEFD